MKHTIQRYVGRDPNLEFLTDSEIAMLSVMLEDAIRTCETELTTISNKDLIRLNKYFIAEHKELLKKLHRM
jgi:hypothetical protein